MIRGEQYRKGVRTYFSDDLLAPVLRPLAGTNTNRDTRAARKYVGPESNLGTIKIVLRWRNLMDLRQIAYKTNRGKLHNEEVHNL